MLNAIKDLLQKVIDDIDAGNSSMSEKEAMEVIDLIRRYTGKTQRMSKYQACRHLNISRATFDNYVREGLLPKGRKEAGFKELSWEQKDLDEFVKQHENKR